MNSPSSLLEKFTLNGSSDIVRFTVGKNIVLNLEPEISPRDRDSSRAHSKLLSEYKWEKSSYTGRILAVRDKLVAYRIFNENTGEAVRVLERDTRSRHLIKDFRHATVDLQWSVTLTKPLLAVVDSNSNLYVYHIDENGTILNKYLNIIRENNIGVQSTPKLTWCPYIPEVPEEDSEQETHLLAVSNGRVVDLFVLNVIKETLNKTELRYDELAEIENAHFTIELESEITTVKISPDATAACIASVDGYLSFYVIESDRVRFAHKVRPLSNQYIEDLYFLDNLDQQKEFFWKFAVVISDSSNLVIFDCDKWNMLSKLRIESASTVNKKLELQIERSARFLFIADYEAANIFCLELAWTRSNMESVPCFASCTQVTFCNPIVYIAPIGLTEASNSLDFSMDEDEFSNKTVAQFVAITLRSLLELNVDLERVSLDQIRPSIEESDALNVSTSLSKLNSKENSAITHTVFDSDKLTELFEERFHEMSERMEYLNVQLEKIQKEYAEFRSRHHDDLATALEKIANEIKLRDQRLEVSLNAIINNVRQDFTQELQSALNSNTLNLQSSMDISRDRMTDLVRATIHQMVVPALVGNLDSICTQLFSQLNEHFRNGIQEFMDQLSKAQRESAVLSPKTNDYPTLIQLIESNDIVDAFEIVLSKPDLAALTFVINKIDPDRLFSSVGCALPQRNLVQLLDRLSQKLDTDTDLKFRYLEGVMENLHNEDPTLKEKTKIALEKLSRRLDCNAFLTSEVEVSSVHKRHARLLKQLVSNQLRSN